MENIIYISDPSHASGGSFRSLMTLKRLKKYNINAYLIIPERRKLDEERIIERIKKLPSKGPLKYNLIKLFIKVFFNTYYAYTLSRK